MTPWTAPEGAVLHPKDSFTITRGAGGGPCVERRSLGAEPAELRSRHLRTDAPGVYSPFTLKVVARRRHPADDRRSTRPCPTGLLAKLAGVPYCSDAALAAAAGKTGHQELADPSCPAASEVGSVTVGAGAGPTPFHVDGSAYLAGPYKGAPLSLAVVTPAIAGPFDLGDVVVRNALYIDPVTTSVRAVSDPIPTILKGIPLSIRSILVSLDRDRFTLNPTSCNPISVSRRRYDPARPERPALQPLPGRRLRQARLQAEARAQPQGRHQAPRPSGAEGGAHRAAKATPTSPASRSPCRNPSSSTTRTSKRLHPGPVRRVAVPGRLDLRIRPAPTHRCSTTRSKARSTCAAPNKLPDLVADLRGQINVVLDGRIDTTKAGGLRATFEDVPDAPVSKFVLEHDGGKKGLLENSTNLCARELQGDGADRRPERQNRRPDPGPPDSCKAKRRRARRAARRRPISTAHGR